MTALVWPPCTIEVTDGLCVFPCFAVPRSIIRYQMCKVFYCSHIPRARATCTAQIYSTQRFCSGTGVFNRRYPSSQIPRPPWVGLGSGGLTYIHSASQMYTPPCRATVEGGSVNRCFKVPVIIANAGYRKENWAGENPWLFSYMLPRAVEVGRRLLPSFPHLAFRESFPTWKHLFTEPPSIVAL
jgi:hypothetical protein